MYSYTLGKVTIIWLILQEHRVLLLGYASPLNDSQLLDGEIAKAIDYPTSHQTFFREHLGANMCKPIAEMMRL